MKTVFISFIFFVTLQFSSHAATLKVTNLTGGPMRIAELYDACGNILVPGSTPVSLENDESVLFPNIKVVMHHYKVCASGKCIFTAMGMNEDIDYELVNILEDGLISGISLPDHWVGQTNCL